VTWTLVLQISALMVVAMINVVIAYGAIVDKKRSR
jgi:hypothetical protein